MIEDLLGSSVRRRSPLGGGVERVDLADGRTVVRKRGRTVVAEAAGLRWLAVPGGPAVPEVLAAPGDSGHLGSRATDGGSGSRDTGSSPGGSGGGREHVLVTAFVSSGTSGVDAAEQFGRELAALHAAGAPAFGSPPPGGTADAWIGTAPMRNDPAADWPTWYAGARVLPYLRTARDAGDLTADDIEVIERVCARIQGLAGPAEHPARLHGDLWSGNVLWSGERVWLIDPAAHGGHRETDLAMLALFGAPHLERILAAYDEAAPFAAGRRDRVPLHQLFPLLVHTVLFGAGYAGQAVRAAKAALRAT